MPEQRNRGLDLALGSSTSITFLDDDFLPADDYLQTVEWCLRSHENVSAVMGHVVVDGARGPGLTVDEGLMVLRAAQAAPPRSRRLIDQPGLYGCNMTARTSSIGALRFDERLVLYGWQEDIDFTAQLRGRGRVVELPALIGVHLGIKAGRVSGVRLGYSQMINPAYLVKKGTVEPRFALRLMVRNFTANLIKSLWSEPFADRPGRLKGNLIGIYHLACGRLEPEYALKLRA